MAGETIITVVGNLTDDPELKFTASGAPVANFTVASTSRTFDRQTNEWKEGDALFLNCSVWRQMAENVAGSLQKGQRVIVTGALKVRNYERQDGSRGTSVELRVDEIGPSLRFATAQVTRIARSDSGGFGGGQQGGAAPAADAWGSAPTASPAQPAASAWDTGAPGNDAPPF